MFSYRCDNCGAQWTVYTLCLDCPFCHAGFYYRQYQDRLYEQRLTNGTLQTKSKGVE